MISEFHAKRYCKDIVKIKNYEVASQSSDKWECHHILEIMPFSGKCVRSDYLKGQGLYFNQEPNALIFLPLKEHRQLHNRKENNPNYGKKHTFSEKQRKNISDGHKIWWENRKR